MPYHSQEEIQKLKDEAKKLEQRASSQTVIVIATILCLLFSSSMLFLGLGGYFTSFSTSKSVMLPTTALIPTIQSDTPIPVAQQIMTATSTVEITSVQMKQIEEKYAEIEAEKEQSTEKKQDEKKEDKTTKTTKKTKSNDVRPLSNEKKVDEGSKKGNKEKENNNEHEHKDKTKEEESRKHSKRNKDDHQ